MFYPERHEITYGRRDRFCLCREIVRMLGGVMEIKSKEVEGAGTALGIPSCTEAP
jgi:hypothetical protein